MTRVFLSIVGGLYLVLAAWCSVAPLRTAQAVGYDLRPGSGQSEFFTVYGGLELALGIIFLFPWLRPADTGFVLIVCLILHACLVAFRTLSFLLFAGATQMAFLATIEWLMLLGTLLVWWLERPGAAA